MDRSVFHRRRSRAGFTLVTLVLMLAIASVAALVIIASIDDETSLRRMQRQSAEAREAAEGGLMEVLNDQRLSQTLPDFETPNLRATYTPPSSSIFNAASDHRAVRAYTANIELIRIAPMSESSHNVVRAVLYQVQVESKAADGVTAGVEAEVYKVATARPGVIQPRSHAR